MSKKKTISYNKETLQLIKSLSLINEKILVENVKADTAEDAKIKIDSTNKSASIAYQFVAPATDFKFEGTDVGFYDFNEFYDLFTVFQNPDIELDSDQLVMSQGRSTIRYCVADAEAIKKGFSKIKFANPNVTFTLTAEKLKELQKMIRLISAENVTFELLDNDNEIKVKLTGNDRDNTFENILEVDMSDTEKMDAEILSITIDKEMLNVIPDGTYKVSIKEEGIVEFDYINSADISLKLYTTENEEE